MGSKTKKRAFIALAMLAGVFFGAAAGGNVSATDTRAEQETPVVEIVSHNVSYSDSIYILYAVENSGFDRTQYTIEMLFWDTVQEEYTAGTEAYSTVQKGTATVKEKDCAVFYSNSLAAKEMTEDIYSRAYVQIDGEEYYSEVVKYSVLDYVYDRRESGELTKEEEALYGSLLGYGGAAQDTFDYKTERPANAEYYKIQVKNGKVPDGFDRGRYQEGEKIVITADEPAEGKRFWYWKDRNGVVVSYDKEFEVAVGDDAEYEAVYKDISEFATQIELKTEVDYDDTAKNLSLPATVSFEYGGETVTLSVTWNTDGFTERQIGTQLLYADFVDQTAYETYDVEKGGIVMVVSTLPYTFDGDTITGYFGTDTALTLPSTYKNQPITTIATGAFNGVETLQKVVVPDTIAQIAQGAFIDCDNIRFITLPFVGGSVDSSDLFGYIFASPEEVTSLTYSNQREYLPIALKEVTVLEGTVTMADYVFGNCDGLTKIVLPDSLTELPLRAFTGCTNLTEVNIPKSTTAIGDYAFYMCDALTELALPEGVTSVGKSAFGGCDNLLSVDLPDSLTELGAYAFNNCDRLTSVVLPEALTEIPDALFNSCNKLKSVTIGANVESLGGRVFAGCANLTSVTIEAPIESIGSGLFSGCKKLKEFVIPESVTSIGDNAFSNCKALTSIGIPESVTSIGASAFMGCSGLTSIEIPAAVMSVGARAFQGCTGLTAINVNERNTAYDCIDGDLYSEGGTVLISYAAGKGVEELKIGGNVTEIGTYAFYGAQSLKSVVIEESVTSIGSYAFSYAENLTSVVIGDGVTSIGTYAFSNAHGLASLVVGSSVKTVGNMAFQNCYNLVEIYNRSTLAIKVGASTYGNVAKYALAVYTEEGYESRISTIGDGYVVYTEEDRVVLIGYTGKSPEVIVPEGVTEINSRAFYNRDDLVSVVLSSTVQTVGSHAFYGCDKLIGVFISSSVQTIGANAFQMCRALTSLTIEEGVTTIGNHAFATCVALEKIVLPDSVTSLGTNGFYGCSALVTAELGDGLEELSARTFANCRALEVVKLGAALVEIHSTAFQYCTALKEIAVSDVNDSYTMIDGCLCTKDGRTLVKYLDLNNATSFIVPSGIEVIGSGAFSGNTRLTSVVLPDSVVEIGESAFAGCTKLARVAFGKNLAVIGAYAFDGCALTDVVLSDSVTEIQEGAFSFCEKLTSVTIGSGVTYIDPFAFDCAGVTTVYYNGTAEQWAAIDGVADSAELSTAIVYYLKS